LKTLEEARADLLAAYQRLEDAQAQSHAIAQHLRACEMQKVKAEAIVALLSAPEPARG
jgi:hypothetical protein